MAPSSFRLYSKPIFLGILVTAVLFLISSYGFSMIAGLTAFFFTEGGTSVGVIPLRRLPIWLLYLLIEIPIQVNIGVVFLSIWVIFAVCFVAAWRLRDELHNVLKNALSHHTKKLFSNCLFALPVVASMTLVAVIGIQSIQETSGIPTGEPSLPENPFQAFFHLSYAALVEEIGFRISPIGVFLIVYLLVVGRRQLAAFSWVQRLKLSVLALLIPDTAKKRLTGVKSVADSGVIGGISVGEWVMVILTAAIFGVAHYIYGEGWQIGKITSAAAVGVALALTYLLYGVQAPVLLHWFFNYYFTSFELAWDLCPKVFSVYLVVWSVTIAVGIGGWVALAILAIQKIVYSMEGKNQPQEGEGLTEPYNH